MIDDITLAARVEGIEDVPLGMLPLDPVRGRPDVHGVSRDEGRLFVTFCPATKIVTLRVSVPRWTPSPRQRVNFPLVEVRSVEDLRPDRLAMETSKALQMKFLFAEEAVERLPLRDWAVIRSSHSVDLTVADPFKTLLGCMGIRRRHEGQFSCFGSPVSTVQWQSRAQRVQLYAKGVELRARRARSEEEDAELRRLAEAAQSVLRFEVSFRQVRGLRSLFGWQDGWLPTLSLMCDPRVDGWVLTREAERLRLFDDQGEKGKRVLFPGRVRHVGATLLKAQKDMAEGQRTVGRRKTLTPARVWDLAAAFFLMSGFRMDEAAKMSDRSPAALAEMVAELRELGIAPDGSMWGSMGEAVAEVRAGLEPFLLESYPPDLSYWKGRLCRVEAPWAEDKPEEPELADDDGVDGVVTDVGIGAADVDGVM